MINLMTFINGTFKKKLDVETQLVVLMNFEITAPFEKIREKDLKG